MIDCSISLFLLRCSECVGSRCYVFYVFVRLGAVVGKHARLDAFARGQIWGMREAGVGRAEIRKKAKKTDGTRPTLRTVDAVLAKKASDPAWRGEDSSAGGRPRALTAAQSKDFLDLVFAERGKAKVTVSYCRQRLPFLWGVCRKTVQRELHHAGLEWLRRRRKTSVPKDWRKKRVSYCRWLLKLNASDARRFAYTDGTTFYLARGPADVADKRRAALGQFVWRMVISAGHRGRGNTAARDLLGLSFSSPPWSYQQTLPRVSG